MRLLFRVAIVLVMCLAAMALPVAPTQAQGPWIVISPDNGVPGDEVSVYGYNFTASRWVEISYDGTPVPVYYGGSYRDDVKTDGDGDFRVTFTIPASYKGAHTVLAEDQDGKSASKDFIVKPGLTVRPEEGVVGTNVTVDGRGFVKNEKNIQLRYYINGNYETITSNFSANATGSWQRTFRIPSSAQGSHKIDAQGEDSTLAEVRDAIFKVTPGISLDESSGSPGEKVPTTGSGFVANERDIRILFEGEKVKTSPDLIRANATGYWQASFEVPEKPKGTYNVTVEGEYTEKTDVNKWSFKVEPGLVLPPGEGYVGMNLTITGAGFAANKDVDVRYDGNKVATGRTNSKGSFNVTFSMPESPHGARPLAAEVGGQVEATANFTMESDRPDVPQLISPPDESRVGFIGKVTPTFEWSGVSDESGVRYSLQIASSANVTTAGFVEPVLSKQGLVGTNYTLNATEALPYGTYYWIVQAIDGADNESGWTAARSFRAGLLPLWAFILAIAVIVAAIGTLVYFFVIRRRIHYY